MSSLFPIPEAFSNASSTTIFTAAVIFISSIKLLFSWTEGLDPKEPSFARPKIPLIGHAIGFFMHENQYFSILRERFRWPIFTLKIFHTRIYVISSPELTQAVFRNSKAFDFDSVMSPAACRVMEYDKHGTDIVCAEPEKGESCYVQDLHQETFGALAKGSGLLTINKRVLSHHVQNLNVMTTGPQRRSLFHWLRDLYTLASAEGLYGAENPVARDHSLIQHIWNFEDDIGPLSLGFMTSITARKGYEARLVANRAFKAYYDAGLDKHATGLVQGRVRAARKWGLTTDEISKGEISILTASVTNTVPDTFYLICYIFSDPELVARLHDEVGKIVTRSDEGGLDTVILDHTKIETDCPLLVSCYNETLRLNKTGSLLRVVLSDTLLNNQYLLKKGSFIQIATGEIHTDPNTWGPDAKDFKATRFLAHAAASKEERKAQNQAFLPFGGGRNLCPGRHLAFTEITSFVAMLVYGFEVTMSDGSALKIPERRFHKMAVASRSPKEDMDVVVRRRAEFEGVTWGFSTES